jgi:predicted secreted Zn-dependent protease
MAIDEHESVKPALRAGFQEAADGIRTHDLLHGKQTL